MPTYQWSRRVTSRADHTQLQHAVVHFFDSGTDAKDADAYLAQVLEDDTPVVMEYHQETRVLVAQYSDLLFCVKTVCASHADAVEEARVLCASAGVLPPERVYLADGWNDATSHDALLVAYTYQHGGATHHATLTTDVLFTDERDATVDPRDVHRAYLLAQGELPSDVALDDADLTLHSVSRVAEDRHHTWYEALV